MTNHFINRPDDRRKVPQIGRKSLATKLAILLQTKISTPRRMQRAYHPEFSLFSATGARKYLSTAERRRFRSAIATLDSRQRLFCEVLFWSGGRVSEALALTADAVDIDDGNIAFITLKRRKEGVVRQVPLPRSLIRELTSEFHLGKFRTRPQTAPNRLWPWSRTTAWRLVKRVMSEAGIAGVAASPKGLRHTFGVNAFQANMPPHLVQRWLGHASLRTTTIYADVSGREERQFAARMWRRK